MASSRWGTAGALAGVLVLASCSSAPVRIDAEAVDEIAVTKRAPRASCVRLGEFSDQRPVQELGTLGFREFVYPDYSGWLRRQLGTHLGETGADKAPLRVELLRAYLETNRATLTFTVVLRSTLAGARPTVHRGSDTRTNWFGSDGELGNFIERASASAINHLLATHQATCTAPI
jgi:hypothetical protein